MTQEEKANAYDKVRGKIALRFGSNVAEEIFSEFEMSEDEKIRKMLIDSFTRADMGGEIYGKGVTYKQVIAWLEKLKVFAEHGAGLYYFGNSSFTYIGSPIWDNDSWLEKQGEQEHTLDIEIPFGAKDSELQEATYLIPEGFHAEIEGDKVVIKKGKQKSAWSKEDEWKFSDILALLRGGENCHYNTPDLFDWLKSIKQRIKGE